MVVRLGELRCSMDAVNDELSELHTQGVVDGWESILSRSSVGQAMHLLHVPMQNAYIQSRTQVCLTYKRIRACMGYMHEATAKDIDRAVQQAACCPANATWRH